MNFYKNKINYIILLYETNIYIYYYIDISRLKQLCERYIADHLDSENILELLQVAEEYQAIQLRMFCIRYIADNEELMELSSLSPELANEIQIVRVQVKANNSETLKGNLNLTNLWNWYRFRGF